RRHAHPGAGSCIPALPDRPDPPAAQRRLLAGLCVYWRSAAAPGGSLRARARQRRARARRVLPHRVDDPHRPGLRRRGALLRRVPVRSHERALSRSWCLRLSGGADATETTYRQGLALLVAAATVTFPLVAAGPVAPHL